MPKKLKTQHKVGSIIDIGQPIKADRDHIEKFLSLTPDWADKSIKPILATEGWMSKGGIDRMGDIVEPGGWELDDFLLYPAFMFHHDWKQMLLGIWTSVEVRNEGLFGRNVIYGTDIGKDAALLINAGVYRAYSVGFNPLEFSFMEDSGIHFQRHSLIETSLVPSPAHLGATIETVEGIKTAEIVQQAKEHNLTLKYFTAPKKSYRKGNIMTPEEIAALETKLAAQVKTETEVKVKELGPKFAELEKLKKTVMELGEKPNLTEGEVKVLIENVTADFTKAYNDMQEELKAVKNRKNVSVNPQVLPGTLKGLIRLEPSVIRGSVPPNVAEQVLHMQKLNDQIAAVDLIMECSSKNNNGDYHRLDRSERIKSLNLSKQAGEFAKAMDTDTAGEGAEWVPIGYSGSLIEDIRQATLIASQFEEVSMTGKTMEVDTDDGDTFAQLIGEKKTVVSGFDSDEETYSSGDMTLVSKKARGRYQISTEMTEDAAFAVMPLYMRGITRSIARSEDRSIMNGNSVADANLDVFRTLGAKDFRKAFEGLRYFQYQTINSGTQGSVNGINGATHDQITHTECRAQMGKYGSSTSDLRIFVSVKGYLKHLLNSDEMPDYATLNKFGPQAVVLQGEVGRIYNVPVIQSEFVDDNLDASGVFSANGNTRTVMIYANVAMYLRGVRRQVEVLTERDIINDVWNMVAFKRLDFKPTFTPSSTVQSVNAIYNIDAS